MDISKLSPHELVELNALFTKANKKAQLPEKGQEGVAWPEGPKLPEEQTIDDLVQELRQGKTGSIIKRKIAGKKEPGAPKGKKHWKQKKRLRRERYLAVIKSERKIKKAELLESGPEGWYDHLKVHWYQKALKIEMTKEEWTNIVWPTLGGRIPIVRRYDTSGPISLGNILVTQSGTKRVLFDGAEWKLKEMGYCV
jgi:hypothetical protein